MVGKRKKLLILVVAAGQVKKQAMLGRANWRCRDEDW